MHFDPMQCVRALTACLLATIFAIPQNLFAQAAEHVVSSAELQKAAVDASRARQQNLDTLKEFFSSERAQRALKAAHTDPEQVKKAVASLNDAEPGSQGAGRLCCRPPRRPGPDYYPDRHRWPDSDYCRGALIAIQCLVSSALLS